MIDLDKMEKDEVSVSILVNKLAKNANKKSEAAFANLKIKLNEINENYRKAVEEILGYMQ